MASSGLENTYIPKHSSGNHQPIEDRFSIGDVIDGRYRVLASLAAGGMGEVFKVEHVALGKQLALKVMLAGRMTDPDLVERFKLEAMSASRIGHRNIIDVSDLGQTEDGVLYFVMELIEGETLTAVTLREGALPPERVIAIATQIAEALAAAHRHGIVHRDLKPDNVMLTEQPGGGFSLKLLDFGIARVKQRSRSNTSVGLVLGTPAYMSPEQAQAHEIDGRTDIYSLGVILHELVTGKPVFEGDSAHMVMVKQVREQPPALPASVPRPLAELIGRMLKKDPAERPQTMGEVLEALAKAKSEDAPTSKGTIVGLAAFGVVVAGVIAVVLFATSEPDPATAPPPRPTPLAAPLVATPKAPPPLPPVEQAPKVTAPSLSPDDVSNLLERAEQWVSYRNWVAANETAEACITADPMKVDCYLIAGDMAMRLGDAEGGKQRYMKFLELAPKDHPKRRHAAEALSTYFGAQGK